MDWLGRVLQSSITSPSASANLHQAAIATLAVAAPLPQAQLASKDRQLSSSFQATIAGEMQTRQKSRSTCQSAPGSRSSSMRSWPFPNMSDDDQVDSMTKLRTSTMRSCRRDAQVKFGSNRRLHHTRVSASSSPEICDSRKIQKTQFSGQLLETTTTPTIMSDDRRTPVISAGSLRQTELKLLWN